MNSHNFIRSFNAFYCTNGFSSSKVTPLKQSLLQCVSFIHGNLDTGILKKSTRTDNAKPVLFLSNNRQRLHVSSNYLPLHLINLNISRASHMHHTLTSVTKDVALRNTSNYKNYSNDVKDTSTNKQLTRKEKLKRAVKEYGSTVIIFHVTISLMSLGICYVLVSSGIDIANIVSRLGLSGSIVTNAGTFVTAYAIHKVFAPVRISITLGATPFIVRYLRRIGFLKVPKNPQK